MSGHRLRLGIVGAGAIAQSYAHALRSSACVEVAAVVDVRPDAALAMAEDLRCEAFADATALAAGRRCEAALVCTPPATHAAIALELLEAGLPVLCEKPLALDLATARTMVAAAERRDVLFTMASKFRFVEDLIRARSLFESGALGDVVLVENAFTSRVDMSRRWNADPAVSGGGVLIDNGTHSVDVVRFLFGPVLAVHAAEGLRMQPIAVEDTVRLALRTERGVLASVDLSWSLQKEREWWLEVYGSGGCLQLGWKASRWRRSSAPEWVELGRGYDKHEALRGTVENFAAAIRGEQALRIGPADALASVAVIEAAYESLRSGRCTVVDGAAAGPGEGRLPS